MAGFTQDSKRLKKRLLVALEKNLGIISISCKEAQVSRASYFNWMKNDEDFKKAVDEINEGVIDFVENQLYKKIEQGSEKSILFYMKYKGRKRGYTDSVDITSAGEKINNIQIEIIKKDKNE